MSKRRPAGDGALYQRANGKWCAIIECAPVSVLKKATKKVFAANLIELRRKVSDLRAQQPDGELSLLGEMTAVGDGRWCATVELAPRYVSQRQRRYIYGATRAEVLRKVRDERIRTGGEHSMASKATVAEFLAEWLGSEAWAPNTRSTYKAAIKHALLHIGAIRLDRLDQEKVEDFYAILRGKNSSKPVGPSMRARVHIALRAAFNSNLARRYKLRSNPFLEIFDAPREPYREVNPASPDEVIRLLRAAESEPVGGALIVLLITTGLRPGEAYGLHWGDVDLLRGTITIRFSLSEPSEGQRELKPPKTKSSYRTVLLNDIAIKSLLAIKPSAPPNDPHGIPALDLVFKSRNGEILRRKGVYRMFARLKKAAGVRASVRLKDLRHAHASMLLAAGVQPRAVADRLGHSSTKMTLDRYSHLYGGDQQLAVERFDQFLFGLAPELKGE